MSQVQMLQGMADSEERIARSRDRERQYETLNRRRQDRRLPA
jgi:type IV secretion system protein VirB5